MYDILYLYICKFTQCKSLHGKLWCMWVGPMRGPGRSSLGTHPDFPQIIMIILITVGSSWSSWLSLWYHNDHHDHQICSTPHKQQLTKLWKKVITHHKRILCQWEIMILIINLKIIIQTTIMVTPSEVIINGHNWNFRSLVLINSKETHPDL